MGPLAAPTIDDARARRVAEALQPAPVRSQRGALLGLFLAFLCALGLHELGSNGSLPARAVGAQGGGVPSIESGDQEMQRMRSLVAGVVGVGVMATGAAAQQAVQWRVEDGGNGHWYAGYSVAQSRAAIISLGQTVGGYPVAISSLGEQQFLSNSFPEGWVLGLHAPSSSNNFTWMNGEPVVFTYWGTSDCPVGPYPNNPFHPLERFVATSSFTECGKRWDDYPLGQLPSPIFVLIEWSADCNGDGIVDYGQCRDGSLPDYNGNNIPDCCEAGTPCAVGSYPVQWRVAEGGNGHWYRLVVPTGPSPSWQIARDNAVRLGGYLATLTTAAENAFAFSVSQFAGGWQVTNATPRYCVGPWLGGFQPPNSPEPAGGWSWVTDEPWSWTNWWAPANEPNNGCGGGEDYLHWLSQGSESPSSWWNDSAFPGQCGIPSPKSYVVEWSADCNNDGIVDFGQILSGQLVDANQNGVPDVCETPACPGDVTNNGVVNGTDLAAVLAAWGTDGQSKFDCDINNDGVVGGSDLAFVLAGWGACP